MRRDLQNKSLLKTGIWSLMAFCKLRALNTVNVKEIAWLINVVVEEEDFEILENGIWIITQILNANGKNISGSLKIIWFA